ncbi:tkl protein kinase [Phialemonium atrogriseum]|uniref:Tkl protein kinase n=1 Tax=Phialemonium atrogriseum TaxID=1093897 RepID=A0AAJ0FBD5_9PEZI|nr:tkl protein kinase [Phialemonium atrogriseum]KAK1762341.1 tkl protein kinase [Phialemonium atrogriseum]
MEYHPPPKNHLDFIGGGASSIVNFLPPDRVLKFAHDNLPQDAEHERKVLEVLGSHPRIVRYFGMWKEKNRSVVLEYHPRGYPRRRWAVQIVEGLVYIHSKGIVHGDLNASNILVTDSDDVVLCDFAGSSLNGEKPVALCFEPRHLRPRGEGEDETRNIKDDLFALGSVLYELYSDKKPYAEKEDHEVGKLYRQGTFPDVSGIPVGRVIEKCWTGGYKSAEQVLADLVVLIVTGFSTTFDSTELQTAR